MTGETDEENFLYQKLKEGVRYFQDVKNIPRSFVKELRNTYPMGESQIKLICSFLELRGFRMPDGKDIED